jgi:hypothetical protein
MSVTPPHPAARGTECDAGPAGRPSWRVPRRRSQAPAAEQQRRRGWRWVPLALAVLLCGGVLGVQVGGAQEPPPSGTPVARVAEHLAAVYAGPGEGHAVLWRLYQGTQVAVTGEAVAPDGARWQRIQLWHSEDGWLPAAALSFDPYPPPPTPAPAVPGAPPSGPCQPRAVPAPHTPQPLAGRALVLTPTPLSATPEATGGAVAVDAGTSVLADAWTLDADGRVRYRVATYEGEGWAAPGSVALQAADPVGRVANGRPLVEPLAGKGMWFVLDSREHGDAPAARVVAAARANGLSHLYVEVATSRGGFWGARWLDALLPAARAAGVRVIGSVYPCLDDLAADLALAVGVTRYRTPDGLALDGLTADIEETLVPANVQAFGELLRHHVGDDYLLVATVYPPESWFAPRYPWPALAASWNAVVPMAYWRQMESRPFTPAEVYAYTQRNVSQVRALAGRPDLPVQMLAQLFDFGQPFLLGPTPPAAAEIEAATAAARDAGAVGISFFDWTRATPAHWEAIARLRW